MDYLISKEYIAGFFDGEGWICITRHLPYKKHKQKNLVYHFRVGIENTDFNVLKKIQKRYGGNIYTRKKRRTLNRKITHLWYLDGNNASNFLLDIKTFLIIKEKQAKLAIKYQQTNNRYFLEHPDYRDKGLTKNIQKFKEGIVQKIRKLNSIHKYK